MTLHDDLARVRPQGLCHTTFNPVKRESTPVSLATPYNVASMLTLPCSHMAINKPSDLRFIFPMMVAAFMSVTAVQHRQLTSILRYSRGSSIPPHESAAWNGSTLRTNENNHLPSLFPMLTTSHSMITVSPTGTCLFVSRSSQDRTHASTRPPTRRTSSLFYLHTLIRHLSHSSYFIHQIYQHLPSSFLLPPLRSTYRFQIRNVQRPTHTSILPKSGLTHRKQSCSRTEVENCSRASSMQVVQTIGVRLVTGVFVDYFPGRPVCGGEDGEPGGAEVL